MFSPLFFDKKIQLFMVRVGIPHVEKHIKIAGIDTSLGPLGKIVITREGKL